MISAEERKNSTETKRESSRMRMRVRRTIMIYKFLLSRSTAASCDTFLFHASTNTPASSRIDQSMIAAACHCSYVIRVLHQIARGLM